MLYEHFSPCSKYRSCTKYSSDIGASDREWRSGAMPTTDYEAHLTLSLKIGLGYFMKTLVLNKLHIDTLYASMLVA